MIKMPQKKIKMINRSIGLSKKNLEIIEYNYPKWGFPSRSEFLRHVLSVIIKKEELKLEIEEYHAD